MTTYAPKFPDHTKPFTAPFGPIAEYERIVLLRNLKVSIGAKLNYGS
jgi:hypothetical protein